MFFITHHRYLNHGFRVALEANNSEKEKNKEETNNETFSFLGDRGFLWVKGARWKSWS